jgi:hypothetical protein
VLTAADDPGMEEQPSPAARRRSSSSIVSPKICTRAIERVWGRTLRDQSLET